MNSKTPFDKKFIRYLLTTNKNFLKTLYDAKSAKQAANIIQKGDSRNINTLIRVLCLQIQGGIPLQVEDVKKIPKGHKNKLIRQFKNTSDTKEFLKKHLSEKKDFLVTISSSYGILLKPLFEKDYSRQVETDDEDEEPA